MFPIQRRLPSFGRRQRESVRHPQFGTSISAVCYEIEPLATAHDRRSDLEGQQQFGVGWRLVVEEESVAARANRRRDSFVAEPLGRGVASHLTRRRRRICDGGERVLGERVFDVHQQQLLMLLFVMQPQGDERLYEVCIDEQRHGVVDVPPIGGDFGDARAREHAALMSRVPVADGVVVAVEQVSVRRIVGFVAGQVRLQDERLEEPRRVRSMPFGRARVGHRLDRLVLRG